MTLAPTQLGGAVTYVIVDGNSMEPGFHLGDLVLVRTEPSYQVGDAVTYQNKEMGKFVFHRIIETELDRFILKGDNNPWLDSYHPNQDEIVGKLWVHIPKLGKAIEWMRLPINLAITMSLLGGILMMDMTKKTPPGKGKHKAAQNFSGRKINESAVYFAGFLTLVFLGLSIFSFTHPLTRATGNIPYQQEGYFFTQQQAPPEFMIQSWSVLANRSSQNLPAFLTLALLIIYQLINYRKRQVVTKYMHAHSIAKADGSGSSL